MARIATNLETILAAARARVVARGVVESAHAFVCDDPEDVVASDGLRADQVVALWWRELTQSPADVSTDAAADEVPIAECDLMATVFVRVNADAAGKADFASADQGRGVNAAVRRTVRALNDHTLVSGSDDILTESLTFRRTANRGKARGSERWRRYDCQFDCMFRWDLTPTTQTTAYTTAGTYTFDAARKVVTLVQVWGAGGGAATAGGDPGDVFQGGGGGGFRSGTPTNTPTALTVVVRAGGAAQTSTSGLYSSVSWDSGASYLRANTGQCGAPVQSGLGGGGSYAGNVTLVGAYAGGTGGSATAPAEAGGDGGGGAGSGGNGGNGGSGPGAGGTPDGGDGATSSSNTPGEQPGGGGAGDYAVPSAGGAGKVVITWHWQ